MQQTSQLYKDIVAGENHWFETKVVINGQAFGEDQILSLHRERLGMSQSKPTVGGALSSTMTLTLLSKAAKGNIVDVSINTLPYKTTYADGELVTAAKLEGLSVKVLYTSGEYDIVPYDNDIVHTNPDVPYAIHFGDLTTRNIDVGYTETTSTGQQYTWFTEFYVTKVDDTLLYFTLTSELTQKLYWTQSAANGVTIDWGDGSTPETVADLSAQASHTYAEAGDYIVTMTAAEGVTWSPGTSIDSTTYSIIGKSTGKSASYPTMTAFVFGGGCKLDVVDAFRNCTSLASIDIPSGITAIPQNAFMNCTSLATVKIPASVSSMGSGAFSDCSSVSAVYIYDISQWCNMEVNGDFGQIENNTNFASPHIMYLNDEAITSLALPNTVTQIAKAAFRGCTNLTSITIPSSVTALGYHAFYGCTGLIDATINASGDIDESDYDLMELVDAAGGLFQDCTSLRTVVIGNLYPAIRAAMFSGCASLSSITIGSGVTKIQMEAFRSCENLTSLEIPAMVNTITPGAFLGTSNLQSYIVDAQNADYKDVNGVLFNKAGSKLIGFPSARAGTYQIASVVSLIEDSAFFGSKLTNVEVVGATVQNSAFRSCPQLEKVWLHLGVAAVYVQTSTVSGQTKYHGPFYQCANGLHIYAEASSKPSGWQTGFNYLSDSSAGAAVVTYNQTVSPW